MTTAPMSLQDLQRRIDVKAKAEPSWRFWGLYVHVCNNGDPPRSLWYGQGQQRRPRD